MSDIRYISKWIRCKTPKQFWLSKYDCSAKPRYSEFRPPSTVIQCLTKKPCRGIHKIQAQANFKLDHFPPIPKFKKTVQSSVNIEIGTWSKSNQIKENWRGHLWAAKLHSTLTPRNLNHTKLYYTKLYYTILYYTTPFSMVKAMCCQSTFSRLSIKWVGP